MGYRGRDTPTNIFDQEKALVAAAGQLRSGSVQISDFQMVGEPTPYQKANAREENPASKTTKVRNHTNGIPKIVLDGIPRQRTETQSSLWSIGSTEGLVSVASTSSNMTAIDVAVCKKEWEEIAELHKKMKCMIGLIRTTLTNMAESFQTQENVNNTAKDGVKNITI